MRENLFFLQRFLREGGRVGSVAPSSRFLVEAMMKLVPLSAARLIVELGGGTGAVSLALARHRKDGTALVIFEPDDAFYPILRSRLHGEKNVTVLQEKAEKMEQVLKSLKLARPDCVVSSLPFASLGKKTSSRILLEIRKALGQEGVLILYQYTLLTLPRLLEHFQIQKFSFVPLNMPPAFVFLCTPRGEGSKRKR